MVMMAMTLTIVLIGMTAIGKLEMQVIGIMIVGLGTEAGTIGPTDQTNLGGMGMEHGLGRSTTLT